MIPDASQPQRYRWCVHRSVLYLPETHWRSFPQAVSLCGTYDLQLHVFLKFIIMNLNLAAYADSVKIDFVLYYNLSVLEDLLDLLDTCLDISLLILAASYSAFSERSPCSLASLIFPATSFLLTTFRSCSSSSSFLSPAYVSKFFFASSILPYFLSKPRCFF